MLSGAYGLHGHDFSSTAISSQTRGNHEPKKLNLLLIILFSPLNDEDFNENFMYKNIINVTKLIPVRSYPNVW